ncbi:DUF6069 family protein [Microbacterium sp. TWP3-1-2b2]|uniref:DUF6069 family protein n=1 Tax=Microbacterium sp. TWP3-1-2b2 TaxID=2804651 RepID=UPI003CF66B4F
MTTITKPDYRARTAIMLSATIVAIAAGIVNALIALGAVALGAEVAGGLQPVAYLTFTVIAAIAGAAGWHIINRYARRPANIINRYARRPANIMRWLAPAFLAVSFIPDIAVGVTMGWLVAGSLMLMHVATISIAVVTYRRLMPLRSGKS